MNTRLLAVLSLTLSLTSIACAQSGADVSSVPSTAMPALVADYGKLPLSFEANQGQVNDQVKFTSRGNGYSLFLTDTEAVLALTKSDPAARKGMGRPAKLGAPFLPTVVSSARVGQGHSKPKNAATDVVRMELAGARHDLRVTGTEQLPGTANYFIGNDPSKWHSNVPTYAKVKYAGVYPGIDLVYYGNQRQLEYDFVVAPGADPKSVRLHFAGARKLRLNTDGNLEIIAKNGEIAFRKPVVYQMEDGQRQPVAARFTLVAKNAVGFTLDSFDHNRGLVIDPVLEYSTYLGGSDGELGYGIAVDADGDVYVTGWTLSTDFPVTSGAFQTVNNATPGYGYNAFITKLNPTGTSLIYSTYLGGSGIGYGFGSSIAVDTFGDAYLTGYAEWSDFPVTSGAFQTVYKPYPGINPANHGQGNAFITKLNPAGTGLIYSTYLGAGADNGAGIAVDTTGNAYVVGTTSSTDFPVTSDAFQKVNNGNGAFSAFITKLNPTGTALIYSTYLGGRGNDSGGGIAVDAAGDAYLTGRATSPNFPVTSGAFQTVNNAPSTGENAFITKLNPSGTALIYSTYLGGSGDDFGGGIAVDAAGDTYVTGGASSPDFPVTSGAFQTVNNAPSTGENAFITKLNPTGTRLIYSTYLGGSDRSPGVTGAITDAGQGIAVDAAGDTYVTGRASSADFPVTSDAFQKVNNAYENSAFMAKLNPAGTELIYSTYLGGSGSDVGYGIALDAAGDAYVAGQAISHNFPVTCGAFQIVNKGINGTGFVAKFAFAIFINPIPQISGISPNYGAPAALIDISGINFGATPGSVTVGCAPSHVVSWSSTEIAIQVPSRATTGNIVVAADGAASNGVAFTFYPYPAIASISPGSGGIGAPVTITGSNLLDGGGHGTVTFNSTPATILSQSSTSIQVDVPAGATTGPVSVRVNGDTVKSSSIFTVTGPEISGINPNYGAPAALIKIAGTNFGATQGNSSVTLDGAPSHVVSWSNTAIAIQVPGRGATGNIVVTDDREASNGAAFTFYPYPAITDISPTSAPVGTPVTITGTNLLDGGNKATVTFNGVPAAIISDTSTSIQANVPSGAASGRLLVEVNGVALIASASFTVLGPEVASISPSYGAPASSVTINGANFGATQGNGYVTIHGAICGMSAWSDTSITIRVPSNASTGNLVVSARGALSNATAFTFYPYPAITTVSPESGVVGTPVTITGTNLLDGGDNATVTFNGTPATISSDTSGQIQVTVPTGATSGRLLVRVNGVSLIAATNFTVLGPEVAGISPSYGAPAATVTISGTNFGTTQGNAWRRVAPVAVQAQQSSNATVLLQPKRKESNT